MGKEAKETKENHGRISCRGSRVAADKNSGQPLGKRWDKTFAEIGKNLAWESGWTGGSGGSRIPRRSQRPCRFERSEPPNRLIFIPWPYGCRKDRTFENPCGSRIWFRKKYDSCRYVRIHGKTECLQNDRIPSGICRFWGGRPAQWKSAPQSVFRSFVWWDWKSASGCI